MNKTSAELQYDEQGNVIGTGNANRLAILQSINDVLDSEREGELTDIVDMDRNKTEPFKATPHVTEEEGEQSGQEHQGQEDDQGDGQPDGQAQREQDAARQALEEHEQREAETALQGQEVRHTIRVNGKERQVTTAELVALAQKVDSADEYLREAKRQAEATKQTPPAQQPSPEDAAAQEEEGLKRIARALQIGSEEEAVAAVRALLARGPSADDLARTVDTRLTLAEANRKFAETYSHITEDPVSFGIAQRRYAELRAQGDNRPFWETFDQIGKEVTGWLQDRARKLAPKEEPKPDPVKVEVSKERVARKESAPKNPKTASAAAGITEPEEQEPNVSDVIAEIAKARGGPQWMAGRNVQ